MDGYLFRKHLENDEEIRMVVHKHWLIGMRYLILPTISFLLSAALLTPMSSQAAAILGAIWAIASLVWWLRNFSDYYLDAWIITNHGIIDLEWLGWFHRQSARILYSDIQGVSTEIQGVAATLLRYGKVAVEKISTGSAISIAHVPRPRRIESAILMNMEAYLHAKNLKNAKHVEELISQFVSQRVQEGDLRQNSNSASSSVNQTRRRSGRASFTSSRIGSP